MKNKVRIGDIIENLFLGTLGTTILGGIALTLYTVFRYPRLFGVIVLALLFVYMVGWCINHWNNFYDLIILRNNLEETVYSTVSIYEDPILDGLHHLEVKYKISTIHFISLMKNNMVPLSMDNLDHLEWVALINELSTMNAKEIGE